MLFWPAVLPVKGWCTVFGIPLTQCLFADNLINTMDLNNMAMFQVRAYFDSRPLRRS
jgi:hypothetical protein